MNIKHTITGAVILSVPGDTLRSADLRSADLRGADLRGADLRGADLRGADLRSANLYGANLHGANLRGADLYGADLRSANLYGANLHGANLRGANLYGADLYGADLYGANLYGADLRTADLRTADLRSADLGGADLRSANLYGADLHGADLRGAGLGGAKNIPAHTAATTSITPEGDLIVYKKLREGVAKLLIPKEAARSNATGRKCRAEFAIVLSLPEGVTLGHSTHDPEFTYKVGDTVRPEGAAFDPDRFNECAPGIHFFLTQQEAETY
uniref:Pentapeptide repeat protein n=1 Tax=Ralstonia phage BOESR1 TaxID=3034917 RepID=A0AA50IHF9_9CAUD|nr:hypothetical protein HIBIKMCM_00009 [Ralstonia phage BOESR1]